MEEEKLFKMICSKDPEMRMLGFVMLGQEGLEKVEEFYKKYHSDGITYPSVIHPIGKNCIAFLSNMDSNRERYFLQFEDFFIYIGFRFSCLTSSPLMHNGPFTEPVIIDMRIHK